jgi:hypothetical protein
MGQILVVQATIKTEATQVIVATSARLAKIRRTKASFSADAACNIMAQGSTVQHTFPPVPQNRQFYL